MRIGALWLFFFSSWLQTAVDPIVQAVLFYSPTCPHCHDVITNVLLPMQAEYGEQLQILGIDVTQPVGATLYENAVQQYDIPSQRVGVPTLVVAGEVLVGATEIPDRFPTLVAAGLAAGGIGWPNLPGLAEAVPDLPPSADPGGVDGPAAPATRPQTGAATASTPAPTAAVAAAGAQTSTGTGPVADDRAVAAPTPAAPAAAVPASPGILPAQELADASRAADVVVPGRLEANPSGFGLAWLVLVGMALALAYVGWGLLTGSGDDRRAEGRWRVRSGGVPALALLGLGVALYLAYVEVAQVAAVCGPVGACNTVQSSPYARLLGIPVAVLGALSYLAVMALWAGIQRLAPGARRPLRGMLQALTLAGTGFSIYLTILELLVIRAVCLWCLSSAVLMTLLMLLVMPAARPLTPASSAPRAAGRAGK